MADFPTVVLQGLEDSKHFTESLADPAKKAEVDGGYTITRARYTRLPRKTWVTGFSDLTAVEKNNFNAFWDTYMGGSNSFLYLNPTDNIEYTVRFMGKPRITYVGMASLRRWEISDIKLEQV